MKPKAMGAFLRPFTLKSVFLKAFILKLVIVCTLGLQYQELQELRNCSPHDSCLENSSNPIIPKNCACDERCKIYGDCCLDSEYYSETNANYSQNSCVNLNNITTCYMKTTCADDWSDPGISELCSEGYLKPGTVTSDPAAKVPATSLETNVTYPNYYCAMCNNDSKHLSLWKIGWDCDGKITDAPDRYLLSNVVFKTGIWGINVKKEAGQEFVGCDMYPILPERLEGRVRSCADSLSECSENFTDPSVIDLCHSYTSTVYNITSYRNIHCALCNYINPNETHCLLTDLGRHNRKILPSFALLFDFGDFSGSNAVGSVSKCERNEIWDPFFRKCRSVVCGRPNQVFRDDRCVDDGDYNDRSITEPSNLTSTPAPTITSPSTPTSTDTQRWMPIVFPTKMDNTTAVPFPNESIHFTSVAPVLLSTLTAVATATALYPNGTQDFQTCHKILLVEGEYTEYENGSVYVENYNKVFALEEYEFTAEGVYVCAPPTNTYKFSPVMAWLALVGMLVSCLCLVIHLVTFFMVPDLQNLSGKNLASLCLALLAAYVTFIVNIFIDPELVNCAILAASMYYFFVSAFCWMNISAFDIWLTFRLTKTQLRVTSGKQWHKFIIYSLYSWLLPAVAVAIVITVGILQPEGIPQDYLPTVGGSLCWFERRKALLVFFALPTSIMIIVNCVFFISTARIIAETTTATSNSTTSAHHKNQFKMHMRLAVLMGFTWLCGTAAGYLQIEFLWYLFVLLNTLQGVLIFLAFTCRRKVWRVMGVTSHKIIQRGSSWISRHVGRRTAQNMELRNSSSPSTSVDGL